MPADEITARYRKMQGDRLTELRGTRTRREIAEALAEAGHTCSPQAIAWWEMGERSPALSTQVALAKVLGVSWSDIFALDDDLDGEVA